MTSERDYLTATLRRLVMIKGDVFRVAASLHEAGYPEVSHDLLAAYQAVAEVYGQVNRLAARTPADRRHL